MASPSWNLSSTHTTQTQIQNACVAMVDKENSTVKRPAADCYGYWHVKPVAMLPPQSVYFLSQWKKETGNPVTQTLLFPGLGSRTCCKSQDSLHSWYVKRGMLRHDLYSGMSGARIQVLTKLENADSWLAWPELFVVLMNGGNVRRVGQLVTCNMGLGDVWLCIKKKKEVLSNSSVHVHILSRMQCNAESQCIQHACKRWVCLTFMFTD